MLLLALPLEGLPEPVRQPPFDAWGFARRLVECRLKAHLMTQEAFARASGLSVNAIASYEAGRRVPRADTLVIICRTVHTTADYLLGLACEP